MLHASFLQSAQDADTLAGLVVRALKEGDIRRAVEISIHFCTKFHSVAESHALHAVALSRLPADAETILAVWDMALLRDPLQPLWLAEALRLAWAVGNTEFSARWTALLEHVFLAAPPVSLLEELEARGWQGVGSVGIHQGELRGWTWQSADETPIFSVFPGSASVDSLEIGPIRRFRIADRALNVFAVPLPKPEGDFFVRVQSASGRDAHGSPVVCSCLPAVARRVKSISRTLAVIVPVFADREVTLACLGSVLASRKANRTPFELVVVWDHGPDLKLYEALQKLAVRQKITLRTPPSNLGFLGAVNFALERHPLQSVILLNADTIVSGSWLDRLHKIGSRPGIGTVTPFGSHAELLSFPSWTQPGDVYRLAHVRRIDEAFQHAGKDRNARTIPVGVGFCMYISLIARERVGGLDGHRLFRGYGEEVDFCLRVKQAGLTNVAACNVFVAHRGERSFGIGKKALAMQNNAALFAEYPAYKQEYDNFLHRDSLHSVREKVARHLLTPLHGPLHVVGNTDIILPEMDELQRGSSPYALLLLIPCGNRTRAMLRLRQGIAVPDMHFLLPRDKEYLHRVIERLAPSALLCHGKSRIAHNLANNSSYVKMQFVAADETVDAVRLQDVDAATWVVAPPRTVHQWRLLCDLARSTMEKGHYFRVLELDFIWGDAPHPANMQVAPKTDILSSCADALLALDSEHATPHWRRWADRHDLPMRRLTSAEAVCA